MMLVTLNVVVIAFGLPYSPLTGILEFKPLGLPTLGLIAGIVILYFTSVELVKRWFYRLFFA